MPFTYELRKIHQADKPRSETTTAAAVELQTLLNAVATNPEKQAEYDARFKELESEGHALRKTNGIVFEMFEEKGSVIEAAIKFQVKGNVITWSFKSAMDETTQEFRNILYNTAAEAHDKVEFGCERYYRGTNSYHVKKMHSNEGEADFNHNHYRRADGEDITPKEVEEHLRAFAEHKNAKFFFPDPSEIDHMIKIFKEYWKEWQNNEDKSDSLAKQYKTEKSQQLDDEDLQEEKQNLHKQEPCRVDKSGLSAEELAKVAASRIIGLDSGKAGSRQVAGSDKQVSAQPTTVVPAPTSSVTPVSMFSASSQTASVSSSTTSAPKEEQVKLQSRL